MLAEADFLGLQGLKTACEDLIQEMFEEQKEQSMIKEELAALRAQKNDNNERSVEDIHDGWEDSYGELWGAMQDLEHSD